MEAGGEQPGEDVSKSRLDAKWTLGHIHFDRGSECDQAGSGEGSHAPRVRSADQQGRYEQTGDRGQVARCVETKESAGEQIHGED